MYGKLNSQVKLEKLT